MIYSRYTCFHRRRRRRCRFFLSSVSRVSRVRLMHFLMRFSFYVFQFSWSIMCCANIVHKSRIYSLFAWACMQSHTNVSIPLADSDLWHFRFFFFRRNMWFESEILIWIGYPYEAARHVTNHNNNSISYFRFSQLRVSFCICVHTSSIGNCSID